MENNEIKLNDKVVWNFVFDVPQENGVVVLFEGDNVLVEYVGWNGKVYRDWMKLEEIELESKWVF